MFLINAVIAAGEHMTAEEQTCPGIIVLRKTLKMGICFEISFRSS